jgi:hypothetical protein
MPVDPTSPTFRGLLAAVRGGGPCSDPEWKGGWRLDGKKGPHSCAGGCCVCKTCDGSGREKPDGWAARLLGRDWLPENGALAADVLRLYARPPEWLREAATQLHALAAGARGRYDPRTGKSHVIEDPVLDDSLRPALAAWAEGHAPPGRAAAVRGLGVDRPVMQTVGGVRAPGLWCVHSETLCHCPGLGGPFATEAAARRALKRAVLGLWDAEVVFEVEAAVRADARGLLSLQAASAAGILPWYNYVLIRPGPILPGRLYTVRQRYRPSDLTPPEPGGA